MKKLRTLGVATLSVKDFQFLIEMNNMTDNPAQQQIERLLKLTDGDTEKLAQLMYDHYHGSSSLTSTQASLVSATIRNMKRFGGVNLWQLQQTLNEEKKDFKANSEEFETQDTLNDLFKKYSIDEKELETIRGGIESLSDVLKRQIFNLRSDIDTLEAKNASGEIIRDY